MSQGFTISEESEEHERAFIIGGMVEDRLILSSSESTAIYGELAWRPQSLANNLEITLGARYTEDERAADKRSINFTDSPNNRLTDNATWTNFNPGVTFSYDFSDDLNAYAKAITGYKAGGYNVRSTEEGFLPPFDEEEMISYEVGAKSTWFARRLRLNAAAFASKYSDMQLQQIVDNRTIFLSDIFNAGKAEINGVELDLTALLADGLSLSLTYGYTGADFTEVVDNNPNSPTYQQNIQDQYVVPYAAEHSYRVSVDYAFTPFAVGVMRANLEYSWIDERYGVPQNEDLEGWLIPDFGTLNGRISLSELPLGHGELQIALWGKNIANKENVLHAMSHTFFRTGYFAELANYGLEVTLQY